MPTCDIAVSRIDQTRASLSRVDFDLALREGRPPLIISWVMLVN
jgi:hypothetical protein